MRPADARYGHVVVDEAQDLSPMQWRAIARRCPTQSFTLAGDEAQAVRAGAAATWDRILEALGVDPGSVARHELTVNYRTPAEVMELAARLLEQFASHLHPARSARSAGVGPRRLHTGGRPLGAADIADAAADCPARRRGRARRGRHARVAGRRRRRRRRAPQRRRREGVGVRRCRRRRSRGHRPRVTGGDGHGAPLRRPHAGDDQADDPRRNAAGPTARRRARPVRAGARSLSHGQPTTKIS